MNTLPSVRIRVAGPVDRAAVLGMIRDLHAHESITAPATLENALDSLLDFEAEGARGQVWIAERAEHPMEPLGYAVLTFGFSLERGGAIGLLDELWVRESARGQRIGSALIDHIAGAAQEAGCRSLHLEVSADNPGARQLYERLEFIDQGRAFLSRALNRH
jgi:ribosomal protein S18 acetylase RimI-like enzyme